MADCCEQCAHYVADEEFGDYCSVNLDEDEMERFLTQSVKGDGALPHPERKGLPLLSALRRVQDRAKTKLIIHCPSRKGAALFFCSERYI